MPSLGRLDVFLDEIESGLWSWMWFVEEMNVSSKSTSHYRRKATPVRAYLKPSFLSSLFRFDFDRVPSASRCDNPPWRLSIGSLARYPKHEYYRVNSEILDDQVRQVSHILLEPLNTLS